MAVEKMPINIRHYLILALGGNRYLHKYIDEIYQERRWEYFELYRNGNMYDDLLIPRHVTQNEEKMKQVAGIVEWCYKHNNFENIYRLIKKGYKFSYQYVQQHRNKVIDFDHFELAYTKQKGGIEKVTDLNLFYAASIVLYLCHRENRQYTLGNYGALMIEAMQNLALESFSKQLRFSKAVREKYKNELDEMFKHYGIPRNMKPMSMGKFFELFIEKQMMEKVKSNPLITVQQARYDVFREGISKYIGSLSNWLKVNGFNEMDLTEWVIITKEDVEIVFLDFIIASQSNSNGLSKQDRDLYIIAILYLQALAEVYKETKRLYLDDSQEQRYIEFREKEKSIKQKEEELERLKRHYQRELEKQVNAMSQLEEELKKTKKELQRLQSELQKREDQSKEFAALREYVYSLNNESAPEQEKSIEELADRIQQKKIAVIGGHPNWINKMKDVLPNVLFVEVDELNRDLSFVDNLDAVFVSTTFFNHTFYRKLMKYMNNNNTKLYYLSGKINVELTLKEMEKALSNFQ